jgi:hypothetical protein
MMNAEHKEMIEGCLQCNLTPWERNFFESVNKQDILSDKQIAVIEKTVKKYQPSLRLRIDDDLTPTPDHNLIQVKFLDEEFRRAVLKLLGIDTEKPKFETEVLFEVSNIDVVIHYYAPGSYIGLKAFELKPEIGDDYPGVMRQIAKLSYKHPGRSKISVETLIVERFDSTAAITEKQMRAMFKANGIRVLTVAEIEAVM